MVEKIYGKLADLYQKRAVRTVVILLVYSVLSVVSLWTAYQLRFDFFVSVSAEEAPFQDNLWWVILWVLPIKIVVLALFRQYSGLLGYFGTPDLYRLAKAVCVGSALVGIVRIQHASYLIPPRGVILIDLLLSFGFLAGFRISCRALREALVKPSGVRNSDATRIVIIGAGDEGADLAKELLNKRGLGRLPVAFLDDDPARMTTRIHHIPVIGRPEDIGEIKEKLRIEEAVIAMPMAPAKRIGEIVKELQRLHLRFVTVPSLDQMTTGKVHVSNLRPVEIQDLLGRQPVKIDREPILSLLKNKVVLVTGAGGSIGSELCRQIGNFNPQRLVMIDHSEYLLFEIEQELLERGFGGMILPLVGNILDQERMAGIFERHKPDVVFHAAAMKHVPMMESQPSEAVKVNTFGTINLAELACKHKVDRFVMISTDKAINPTSVMGATKRLAEMYVQALSNSEKNEGTHFMAVRFGNVLGSSGSVIPTFNRQISAGGPVKVTHPDVTRYFMTIPEAVGLVLQCGTQGSGGEIFVLDMGEPIKIADLARQLVELSGLKPDEDIEIKFVGLRPGEKLFEELQHSEENTLETQHSKIMRFVCDPEPLEQLKGRLAELEAQQQSFERSSIKMMLKTLVPEYKPFLQ